MRIGTQLCTLLIVGALFAGAAATASAQSIPHWVDRQVHGTARHVTPRHHKPGEAPYPGEAGYPERFKSRRHTRTWTRVHRHRRTHHTVRRTVTIHRTVHHHR